MNRSNLGYYGESLVPRTIYGKNLLANGGALIAQRGTSFTSSTSIVPSDGAYLFDQWYMLFIGTVPSTVDRVTTNLDRGQHFAFHYVAGAVDTRFGHFQYLETDIVRGLREQVLSFQAIVRKTGTSLGACAMTVWYTEETGDSEAKDLVSSWSTDIVATANWTVLGTVPFTVSVQSARVAVENLTLPSTATNVIVGVYVTDPTTDSGIEFFVGNLQLEIGNQATEFEHVRYGVELARCLPYCYAVEKVTDTDYMLGIAQASSTSAGDLLIQFPIRMRSIPTVTKYGIVGNWDWFRFAGASVASSASFTDTDVINLDNAMLGMTVAATPLTVPEIYLVKGDGNAGDERIVFSNEQA